MPSSRNDFVLIPYCEINGTRTLPDSFLAEVFQSMSADLLKTVFHESKINSLAEFMAVLKNPANIPVFMITQDRKCAAFCWLNGIRANSAWGHFCYFRESGIDPKDLGKATLDYWFSLGNGRLDVILGSIPSFNVAACIFIERVGLTRLGSIPSMCVNPFTGEKCSAVIFYRERRKHVPMGSI